MLIPKLFLGLASTAGIGGLVSLSSMAGGDDNRNVWKVNSQNSFPLFSCQQGSSKVLISLELKNKESSPQSPDNKEVILVGSENSAEEQTIASSSTGSSNTKTYTLSIFSSGSSKLEVKKDSSGLSENLWCDSKNVFTVTGQMSTVTGSRSEAWSKSFEQIQLTLSECKDKSGRQECSIKIQEGVGLAWKEGFEPKVIF